MKKIKILFLLILTGFLFSACVSNKEDDLYKNKIYISIEIQNYGTLDAELYPDVAPITVEHFVSLVKSGFYDGLTFHRIIDGFMIQGGITTDNKIKGEFKANGFTNNLKHERGVISMARKDSGYDTASSQFFIVQTTNTSLDGQYAAFGKITSGMEIVDKICKETKVENSNGTVLVENQPIITKITVKDGS